MIKTSVLIRTTREAQGLSQEELCYGICSISTLSRIESGDQTPSRMKFEALMEKLRLPLELYPSFVSEKEVDAYRLKHQIGEKFEAGQYEEVETLLDKFDTIQNLEQVYENYARYVRAELAISRGQPPGEALAAMKEIAKLFVKDIEPNSILHQALTRDDLLVLNSLAICYCFADKQDDGIELFYALKGYIERKVIDDKGISSIYTVILYNLSKFVGQSENYKEVIRLCDIGIQRCIEYRAYLAFGSLLFNKGYALFMTGNKDEARKYIQEAYYLRRATGELERCEIYKNFADDHGIDLNISV